MSFWLCVGYTDLGDPLGIVQIVMQKCGMKKECIKTKDPKSQNSLFVVVMAKFNFHLSNNLHNYWKCFCLVTQERVSISNNISIHITSCLLSRHLGLNWIGEHPMGEGRQYLEYKDNHIILSEAFYQCHIMPLSLLNFTYMTLQMKLIIGLHKICESHQHDYFYFIYKL